MQRTWVTIGMIAFAAVIVWAMSVANQTEPGASDGNGTDVPAEVTRQQEDAPPTTSEITPEASDTPAIDPTSDPPATPTTSTTPTPAAVAADLTGLSVRAITEVQDEPVLGGTDRDADANPYMFEVRFTPWGGGIIHVKLSRYSKEVNEHIPYTIQQRQVLQAYPGQDGEVQKAYYYPMAAESVVINGKSVTLRSARWEVDKERSNENTAVFRVAIVDAEDSPVLRITRVWKIDPGRYDITLTQSFENLTSESLDVRFTQQGQVDLPMRASYMGDRRALILGHLQPYGSNPDQKFITIDDDNNRLRQSVVEDPNPLVWPLEDDDPNRDLIWTAMVNRYFTVAVHPAVPAGSRVVSTLESDFPVVRKSAWAPPASDEADDIDKHKMALHYDSVPLRLSPAGQDGATRELGFQVYAGPKAPDILKVEDSEYQVLGLDNIIIYNLGGMCALCTFAWLADILMWFFNLIHVLVADWGMAIIVLVAIVRGLLHPITKNAQLNMMKMSEQMKQIQPEMERLKEKFSDNPQKLNQEMMKLYQEKGVNPLGMGLGCLPMFLQMPIWIALYAVLYFAIELRHQPAFWGVFQAASGGEWQFMADLSSQDGFIPLPHIDLWFVHIDALNILPILWGVVMYFNQKYMMETQVAPPANEQAAMQQKMMKYMMLAFPFLLYKAPCGLTLYILASTSVGIVESRRVRAHMNELKARGEFDLDKQAEKKKSKKPGFLDSLMENVQQKMEEQQGAPGKGPGPKKGGSKKPKGGRRRGRRGK